MRYEESDLKKLQGIELEILKEVQKICEKNEIEFFIIGGTALGAKRHGGFIPWDDDIDIGMTRENYNKFLEISQVQLNNHFFLQTPYTDINSTNAFAKVRKDNTKFIEWRNRNIKMHNGIYIDVFPYDNIPDAEILRKKQFNKVQRLQKYFVYKQTKELSEKPDGKSANVRSFFRKVIHCIFKLVPMKFLISKLEKEMCRYNHIETRTQACLFFPKYMVECMDNEVLYPIQFVNFENMHVPAPNDIDEYLKTHYGEYMTLPPQSQRVGHKPCILEIYE